LQHHQSGKDNKDGNIHLTDFSEACSTINPDEDSKSEKNDLGCLATLLSDVPKIA